MESKENEEGAVTEWFCSATAPFSKNAVFSAKSFFDGWGKTVGLRSHRLNIVIQHEMKWTGGKRHEHEGTDGNRKGLY